MGLNVLVDRTICVGNGHCIVTAPGVFVHNDDRQSVVVDPIGADPKRVIAAARGCPVWAIRVEDAETGVSIFP
jgi:ferredoxin